MVMVREKIWEGVPRQHLELVLPKVLPLLRSLPMDRHTVDDVLRFLDLRVVQLWVYGDFETLLITEINHHPQYSVLVLLYGAGKISPSCIRSGRDIVLPWAKSYGCTKVEVSGRKGWGRMFNLRPLPPSFQGDI